MHHVGVAAHFAYPCPGCRTTSNLHDPECRFDGERRDAIEKAYTDIVAVLSVEPRTERELRNAAHEWSARHQAALDTLRREHRVREEGDVIELLTPEERKEHVSEPTAEPLRTIYEEGSVSGAHDNSVFALIAFYEMVGFTWEETREKVIEWLHESGTWARGGFDESSPEELVDSKRHVYEEGYGWKEKAQAAKRVIDRAG
jgi:hypothetical protein